MKLTDKDNNEVPLNKDGTVKLPQPKTTQHEINNNFRKVVLLYIHTKSQTEASTLQHLAQDMLGKDQTRKTNYEHASYHYQGIADLANKTLNDIDNLGE